jgi:hypothetical protein
MKNFTAALTLAFALAFTGTSYAQCTGPGCGQPTRVYRSAPVYSRTTARTFFNRGSRVVRNTVAPRYLPSTTTYNNVYSVPPAPFVQPQYQQVTETRYKKVCNGSAGCSYQPYSYTYMKRVR